MSAAERCEILRTISQPRTLSADIPASREGVYLFNHKNYNFLAFDWFKKGPFSTNSLAKLLSYSLLLDSLLLDKFVIGQFKKPITFKV